MSEYLEQSLALLRTSQLITTDGLKKLSAIQDELRHNFEVGQIFRSRWEMENSVLNDVKFPTADAKYWQAVREQQTHFQELVLLSYEYRKTQARIKLLQAKQHKLDLFDEEQVARNELFQVDIEKHQYMLIHLQRTAQDRIREVLSWHEIMEILKPHMKYGQDSYEDHQEESYLLRFRREMEIAKGSAQSPSEKRNLTALYEMAMKGEDKVNAY